MTPFCTACSVFMRCAKTGTHVMTVSKNGPYELWHADRFECPKCNASVAVNYGDQPVARHFDDAFDAHIEHAQCADEELFTEKIDSH
jgi:competence CoiA-like predicted nuclease